MSVNSTKSDWIKQFTVHSTADLDAVIGERVGLPVGMTRSSPPEFRRRVLAAVVSYHMDLRSIDYALRKYVDADAYDLEDISIGDKVSDFLKESLAAAKPHIAGFHTADDESFGRFGTGFTLFKFPDALDIARMLANRGAFLEVLPILRLCLEMGAWAAKAFYLDDDNKVRNLKASNCIAEAKPIYQSVGRIYGYLSKVSHWEHAVHSHFLNLSEEKVSIIRASSRHRAISLALCLVILDFFVEIMRNLYSDKASSLIFNIQGCTERSTQKKTFQLMGEIVEFSNSEEFQEIQSLLS